MDGAAAASAHESELAQAMKELADAKALAATAALAIESAVRAVELAARKLAALRPPPPSPPLSPPPSPPLPRPPPPRPPRRVKVEHVGALKVKDQLAFRRRRMFLRRSMEREEVDPQATLPQQPTLPQPQPSQPLRQPRRLTAKYTGALETAAVEAEGELAHQRYKMSVRRSMERMRREEVVQRATPGVMRFMAGTDEPAGRLTTI